LYNGVKLKSCRLYTDGSCWNASKPLHLLPSTYCAVIVHPEEDVILHVLMGFRTYGTSNIAELEGIISGIDLCNSLGFKKVVVNTDSKYSIKQFVNTDYLDKNTHLADKLNRSTINKEVIFKHIPRDSGNKYNKLADKLAGELRKKITPIIEELYESNVN